MTRPPRNIGRCGYRGCRLAYGHIGVRHDSTPLGRALHAAERHAEASVTGPKLGFQEVRFIGIDQATFILRGDPGA